MAEMTPNFKTRIRRGCRWCECNDLTTSRAVYTAPGLRLRDAQIGRIHQQAPPWCASFHRVACMSDVDKLQTNVHQHKLCCKAERSSSASPAAGLHSVQSRCAALGLRPVANSCCNNWRVDLLPHVAMTT